jgi:hypothetical protein
MAGVRYSAGMDARGDRLKLTRSSSAERAENPTSRRVTVVIRTRLRWILEAHSAAPSFWARRTKADLTSTREPRSLRAYVVVALVAAGE